MNWYHILNKTQYRDRLIFALFAVFVTALFYISNYSLTRFSPIYLSIPTLILGQFYLSAYINFPLRRRFWRIVTLWVFHLINYYIFRIVLLALTPPAIKADPNFEILLTLVFLLVLIGRNIRMYGELSRQVEILHNWNRKKALYEKPEYIKIHLGEPGLQELHPNEIVYIRTKAAGDHTKVFGIRSRENDRFREYETTHYQNFKEIFNEIQYFPQFKRISQSTVINLKYPFSEKSGVIELEGRRFAKSPGYTT